MKRLTLLLFIAGCTVATRAQAPFGWITPAAWSMRAVPPVTGDKKISYHGFVGMQFGAFPGVQAGVMAVKPISKNWSTFAAVRTGPGFGYSALTHALPMNTYQCTACLPGRYNGNQYSVEGGLMYTNPSRTFSVSGSVRYTQYQYPGYRNYPSAPPTKTLP